MTFSVGDVVVLKSGGARMTIAEIGENSHFRCVWQSPGPSGVSEQVAYYAAAMLRLADSASTAVASPGRSSFGVPDDYKVYEEGDD